MAEDGAFKEMQASISSALVNTTRISGQIAGQDLPFHRSLNPSVGPLLDRQASRLLSLAQNLIRVSALGTEVTVPRLEDEDSVDDNWRGIVDVIDNLLEKADATLDEYTGLIKKLGPSQTYQDHETASLAKLQPLAKSYRTQEMEKPQLLFDNVPTNDETSPFKPMLRSKPHAIVSLEESLVLDKKKDGSSQYKNPYETEIANSTYPDTVYQESEPIPFLPLESTQATLVDTPEMMIAMLKELKQAKEIAIDLEHHDTHSFAGLVSLMQISTRGQDWIVDTLKPWRQDLQVLNEVFTDPQIIKVLHGAYMDMVWLQRDLGLYVVNLFDTFHASRCLGYPRNSLAMLLKRFVNFDANKQYQMADWRIRPLPKEMFDYARSDTHFLLYIYDNMRNELLEKSRDSALGNDLIGEVLKRSKVEALQRYEHNFYDEKGGQGPGGWLSMLSRTPNLFNKEQFAVFRAVHQWRDRVARSEDEGLTFVMPKHVLFTVARIMPTDMPSLLKSYHPMSVMLRSHLGELLGVIKQAKLAGASGPELKEYIKAADPVCIRDQNENIEMGSSKDNRAPKEGRNSPPTPVAQSSQLSRVYTSQFWGSTVEENILSEPKIKAQMQLNTIRLALPLPQLTAEIFDSATSETKTTQENVMDDPGARAEHRYVKAKKYKDDDTFVIKVIKKSRKRKAAEIEDPPRPISAEPDTDEVLNNNQDYQEGSGVHSKQPGEHQNQVEPQPFPLQLTKSQRKKKARRLKKAQSIENARRLDEERQTLGSDNAEGEKAFDYASAPSVLHAAKEKNGRTGVQQSFDPYAKSLNAPNGMRKLRKEVACKSFTFKQ